MNIKPKQNYVPSFLHVVRWMTLTKENGSNASLRLKKLNAE